MQNNDITWELRLAFMQAAHRNATASMTAFRRQLHRTLSKWYFRGRQTNISPNGDISFSDVPHHIKANRSQNILVLQVSAYDILVQYMVFNPLS